MPAVAHEYGYLHTDTHTLEKQCTFSCFETFKMYCFVASDNSHPLSTVHNCNPMTLRTRKVGTNNFFISHLEAVESHDLEGSFT